MDHPAAGGVVDHERSYRGLSPRALLHRARLRAVLRTLRHASLGPTGAAADFGCSNGFILSQLRARILPFPGWQLWGFDHAPAQVASAERREIPGARFALFDLDLPHGDPPLGFDLVLCLETLEHTSGYRTPLRNLARAVRPGGLLLLTVPNERGLPGLAKFLGRRILTPRAYDEFFQCRPQGPYLRALWTGADLEPFRDPLRHGWSVHLGFDLRSFEAFLDAELLSSGAFRLALRRRTAAGFGRLYLLRRVG